MDTANAGNTAGSKAGISGRRSERILLRIPIEVAGTGADGKPFKEKTCTLAINRHGARIVLNQALQPDARLNITNHQNAMSCAFRVVMSTGHTLGEGSEWGVECLNPGINFWGIFFPTKSAIPPAQELIDVLLECSKCHSRELAQLTLEQYHTIIAQPSLSRGCANCRKKTEWIFSFVESDRGGKPATGMPPASTASPNYAEKRRAKRMTIKLPVRIRLEEIGRTENLSKTGVCFASQLIMKVGDRVMLTVGYTTGGNEHEVRGRIVWRQQIEGTSRGLYGVQLEEEG
jgi:hypothetical protein